MVVEARHGILPGVGHAASGDGSTVPCIFADGQQVGVAQSRRARTLKLPEMAGGRASSEGRWSQVGTATRVSRRYYPNQPKGEIYVDQG